MPTTLAIDGTDYSSNTFDWDFEDESIYLASEFNAILHDFDLTIQNAIKRYSEIKLYKNSTHVFTGVIDEINSDDNDSGELHLHGMDYWFWVINTPVYRTISAGTLVSDAVTTIINEDLADKGLTANVTTTTETVPEDIISPGRPAAEILQELADLVDFIVYVNKDKEVVFKSRIATDSGVSLDYANNDILNIKFEKKADIYNVVRVNGSGARPPNIPARSAEYEDDELINKYADASRNFDGRLPTLVLNRPELLTDDECFRAAQFEVRRRKEDPLRANVMVSPLNTNITPGSLLTLSYSKRSIEAETFYIQSVYHSFTDDQSEASLIYYTRKNADLVNLILDKARKAESYATDISTVPNIYKSVTEMLAITASITVERRSVGGAIYGEFAYSENYYGQVNATSFTTIVSDEKAIVLNQMFEDWLRIIAQIATVPNLYDGTNTHIGVGTGSSNYAVTDTTMYGEQVRPQVEAGFPQDISEGDKFLSYQILVDDTDVTNITVTELAMFNASSSGSMPIAKKLNNSVSKSSDETLRITIKLGFTGSQITTFGKELFRDAFAGRVPTYLDNTNSAINVVLDGTPLSEYNEGMPAGFPKFYTPDTKDKVVWKIVVSGSEVQSNSLDGETFTEVDLHNNTTPAAGNKVIDATVAEIALANTKDVVPQFVVAMERG